jgi:hypothetical protein
VVGLRLVEGRATAHHANGAKLIRQGHIDGLCRIDRELLSILFDGVVHSDRVTIPQIDDFSARHPYAYWTAITKWRRLVRDEARSIQLGREGEHRISRGELRRLKSQVRDQLAAGKASGRLGALGVVFGLSRELASALSLPKGSEVGSSPSSGADSWVWLFGGAGHARAMGTALSPYYSSGFAPVQTVGLTPPSHSVGGIGMSSGGGAGGGFSGGGGAGGGGGGGGAG